MKSDLTRDRILAQAKKSFIQNGIQNTQMQELAKSLQLNRRTLYRYFPTKDELAFAVELLVLKQLNEYFTLKFDMIDTFNFTDIHNVLENINISDIHNQLRFTAEFDRYFQKDYPNSNLEDTLIKLVDPSDDKLFLLIKRGISEGFIRDDLLPEEIYHFITQTFLGLFQRIIILERHLKNDNCENMDFKKLFGKIIIEGIKKI